MTRAVAAAWPAREVAGGDDASLATRIGDQRKIVVSRQRLDFTWRNSEQLEGELIAAVKALKAQDGGDIAISGSISIVRQLLEADLIDELHLLIHPIAVRDGKRLFEGGASALPLSLLNCTTFTTGVLHVVYGPTELRAHGSYREASRAMARSLR